MKSLREAIQDADARSIAIGHFNISDSNQFKAITDAARELSVPVIIGVSESERKWIGVREVAALVASMRASGQEVYLNADHTKSVVGIREAIEAGFDAVLYDGSELPTEENMQHARESVALARASGRDVLVEGELGYIGSGSEVRDSLPEGAGLVRTDPEEASRFVRETGIDLLAPSVGNVHGLLKDNPEKRLDLPRIASIHASAGVPLVLHGGSGTNDGDFVQAIENGVRIVHINTEIRVAYRKGIEAGLAGHLTEVAPAKYLDGGVTAMKEVVVNRLKLFNRLG